MLMNFFIVIANLCYNQFKFNKPTGGFMMSMIIKDLDVLDTSNVIMYAYEIGDMVNSSAEVADYLYWKTQKEQCKELEEVQLEFNRKKQLFEECERFGHFHPNYHQALDEVKQVQDKLSTIEAYLKFKEAEERLDNLLYSISQMIAHSVSESIKVPSNQLHLDTSHGGCSSGGSCSGKCG